MTKSMLKMAFFFKLNPERWKFNSKVLENNRSALLSVPLKSFRIHFYFIARWTLIIADSGKGS